jgi:hypothetical protein
MVVGDGQSHGRIAALGPQSFAVSVAKPGRLVVREHYTPFWAVKSGAACVEAAGNWTVLHARRAGMVRVGIDFTPGRALQGVIGDRDDC